MEVDDTAIKAVAAAVALRAKDTTAKDLTEEEKTTYKDEIDKYKAELRSHKLSEMKTTIGTVLKENVKNAMAKLAPVEEVIYALAQGNGTDGLLTTAKSSDNVTAVANLNEGAAKLAMESSQRKEPRNL